MVAKTQKSVAGRSKTSPAKWMKHVGPQRSLTKHASNEEYLNFLAKWRTLSSLSLEWQRGESWGGMTEARHRAIGIRAATAACRPYPLSKTDAELIARTIRKLKAIGCNPRVVIETKKLRFPRSGGYEKKTLKTTEVTKDFLEA